MLVLSRRPKEKIIFPGIHIAVQVVAVKQGAVRLGIEAPPDVTVMREEVWARAGSRKPDATAVYDNAPEPTLSQISHLLRDWVAVAIIGLALLRRQLQEESAEATTLDEFDQEIGALRQQMRAMGRHGLPKSQVLLVEEARNRRDLLAGLLYGAGFEVATAGDGAAALDHLHAQRQTDVVLLDMAMRGCNGPALAHDIRGDLAHTGVKIFGMAGRPSDRYGLEGKGRDIDHWFASPLNADVLLHDLDQELAGLI